jgi:hypothetical protein
MGFFDFLKNPAVQAGIMATTGATTGGLGSLLSNAAIQMALRLGANASQGKRITGRSILNEGLSALANNVPRTNLFNKIPPILTAGLSASPYAGGRSLYNSRRQTP